MCPFSNLLYNICLDTGGIKCHGKSPHRCLAPPPCPIRNHFCWETRIEFCEWECEQVSPYGYYVARQPLGMGPRRTAVIAVVSAHTTVILHFHSNPTGLEYAYLNWFKLNQCNCAIKYIPVQLSPTNSSTKSHPFRYFTAFSWNFRDKGGLEALKNI